MAVDVRESRLELTAVDKASQVVKQVQGSFKALQSSIDTTRNALAAVGVTVGVGAMAQLARDILHANAALDDMAEITGASVENLSKLQQVAKIGGHDFDFITESLVRLTKGLKGADAETENAGYALESLGIKSKDASGRLRDPAEVLEEVAKKLNGYGDSATKTALLLDLFGKAGAKLNPMLKDLAEAGERSAKVTAEQAAQAETLEKNLNRLAAAGADWKRALVIEYTPAVIEFTERLLAAKNASGGLAAALATMLTSNTSGNIGARLKEINEQLEQVDSASRVGQRVGGYLGWIGSAANASLGVQGGSLMREREYLLFVQRQKALAGDPAANMDTRDRRLAQKFALDYTSPTKKTEKDPLGQKEAENFVRGLEESIAKERGGGILGDFDKLRTRMDDIAKKFPQVRAQAKPLIDELQRLKVVHESAKAYAAEWDAIQSRIQAADDAFASFYMRNAQASKDLQFQVGQVGKLPHEQQIAGELYRIEQEKNKALSSVDALAPNAGSTIAKINKEAADQATNVIDLYARLRNKQREATTGLESAVKEYLDAVGNQAQQTHDLVTRAFGGMEDALVQFAMTGKLNFTSFANSVIADIIRIQVRQNVSGPLAAALSSSSAGWLDNLFGRSGNTAGMSNGEFGATVVGGPGFAAGIDYVPYDMTARIHQGERVVPAAENARGGGSGGPTVFIDARGADPAGLARVEAAIRSVNGSIERRAVAAVASARAQRLGRS